MRAVTYHRVSTVDQDPTIARAELARAVLVRGWTLVDRIEETGSGANNDRPGLVRVMKMARRGELEAVVVWKLDRFGRGVLDLLTNVRELERAGVVFVASSQGLETGPRAGAVGGLILTILAAVAEWERDIIRERTVLGVRAAQARGVHCGRPRKKSKKTATWPPEPDAIFHPCPSHECVADGCGGRVVRTGPAAWTCKRCCGVIRA